VRSHASSTQSTTSSFRGVEGHRLRGARAERQADIGDGAGRRFLGGFDQFGLHAHLLIARGVGEGG